MNPSTFIRWASALLIALLTAQLSACCLGSDHIECSGAVEYKGQEGVVGAYQSWDMAPSDALERAIALGHERACANACLKLPLDEERDPQTCKQDCMATVSSDGIHCRVVTSYDLPSLGAPH